MIPPLSFALLGATGDLARKKLLPALFDLAERGILPERVRLIGVAHSPLTDEEYRAFITEQARRATRPWSTRAVAQVVRSATYITGSFDDRATFARVREALEAHDRAVGMCTSKLFYLAVPPVRYREIFEQIAAVDLAHVCDPVGGWVRILVEKPFGSDLLDAQHLEEVLSRLFRDEQIYRIDHYLAKDALRNILTFRFSNRFFEGRWHHEHVEAVHIRIAETFGVDTRGAFFDAVGALRDVAQNHLLQMLALIAMERPQALTPEAIRARRAETLRMLCAPQRADIGTRIVKGQYAGYHAVPNVDPRSQTETYVALTAYLDAPAWRGVPFFLEHGKALAQTTSDITVRFRSASTCACGTSAMHDHPNLLRFSVSPERRISARLWVRRPGSAYELESHDLTLDRSSGEEPDAYEALLYDALSGDQTLFVSSAEHEAAWTYSSAVLDLWRDVAPVLYAPGTNGPDSPFAREVARLIHAFV